MADSGPDRPGSRGYQPSPIPPSPRPSVASRASRSSLRREQERHGPPSHPRPASVAYSRPHTPRTATAAAAGPLDDTQQSPSPPPPHPTRPPFSPVFALVASTSHTSNRQTIHHPTVHYIFADDDPDILTAALAYHHGGGDYGGQGGDGESDGPDRGILLDMEPTADGSGYEVAWASSLTPDWAVTSASLSRMEAGSGGGVAGGLGDNLVLKIDGVSIDPSAGPLVRTPAPEVEMQSSEGSLGRQHTAPGPEDYVGLLQDFEKRMATLRKVVEAGAARQRALGDVAGQFSDGAAMERGL